MTSKRFKKLPVETNKLNPKTIDKIYKNYVTLENLTKYSAKEVSEELGLNIKIAKKIQTSLEEIYN